MKDNFTPSLAAVLVHEGGYVLNRHDPGGATCFGVTQAVYDDWRVEKGDPKQTVRDIASCEVEAIYRQKYWNAIRGDELPAGLDYCLFDFAFNSGPNRAIRFLQKALEVADDGQLGPVTLAVAKREDAQTLIDQICNLRLGFLQQLRTWQFFGKGWSRRVAEVRAKAKDMAA